MLKPLPLFQQGLYMMEVEEILILSDYFENVSLMKKENIVHVIK